MSAPEHQPTLYGRAAPLSRDRHRNHSVKILEDFGYCRRVNSLPLTAAEFRPAALEYPIVFAEAENVIVPVVVLGVRAEQNLFVDEGGKWQGRYVPAFLRRYPFVFATGQDRSTFALCVDEDYPGLNTEGRGERLFDSDGEQTAFLKAVTEFLKLYQVQYNLTQTFARHLQDLGVLESVRAQIKGEGGERIALGGFKAVNRQKLKALDDEQLLKIARSDELELVYLHLQSLNNLQSLARRAGNLQLEKGHEAELPGEDAAELLKGGAAPSGEVH